MYKPDGAYLTSTSVYITAGNSANALLALPNLPVSGIYTVRVQPANGVTGSITAAITQDASGTLNVDGTATAVSVANQTGRFSFSATAGQRLGLGVTGLVTAPSGQSVTIRITKPDGNTLTTCNVSTATGGCVVDPLTVSGNYLVIVSTTAATTARFSLQLSSDATAEIATGGASATLAPMRAGQTATFGFAGTVGQNLNIALSGVTFSPYSYFSIYKPDGTYLAGRYVYYSSGTGSGDLVALPNLPASGRYTVRIVPTNGAIGSVTAAVTQDVTGALTVDGAATAVTLANQSGRYTFSGTAGQRVGLGIVGLATTPSGKSVTVSIVKPDGATLVTCTTANASDSCLFSQLSLSGTYRVVVGAGANASAALNLQLSSDLTTSLVIGGAAATLTPTRAGQSATFSFAGTAAQNLRLALSGATFSPYAYAYVYKPDGAYFTSSYVPYASGTGGSAQLALTNLPDSGNYTVRVQAPNGAVGSVTAAIRVAP